MRRVESLEDFKRGVVTFEIESGQHVCVDERAYREMGIAGLRQYLRLKPLTERLPVFQSGRQVGTMAPDFDPMLIKPTGMGAIFYQPRPGDFTLEENRWIADKMLGPGDLESIPGFVWERDEASTPQSSNPS